MTVYEIDGVIPVVDPTAFVHPSAVLIGDVVIGPGERIVKDTRWTVSELAGRMPSLCR